MLRSSLVTSGEDKVEQKSFWNFGDLPPGFPNPHVRFCEFSEDNKDASHREKITPWLYIWLLVSSYSWYISTFLPIFMYVAEVTEFYAAYSL